MDEYTQYVIWLLDITDEPYLAGQPGYLSQVVSKHISRYAHKIHCCNRFKGKRKQYKAVRRLFNTVCKTYPLLMNEAFTMAACHDIKPYVMSDCGAIEPYSKWKL